MQSLPYAVCMKQRNPGIPPTKIEIPLWNDMKLRRLLERENNWKFPGGWTSRLMIVMMSAWFFHRMPNDDLVESKVEVAYEPMRHGPVGKKSQFFEKKKKNKSERPSIWKFQNILDLPQFKETASLNPLTSPKSDGAQTQGWQWSPCRSRWSVEPEQETTSSPPHPDQPKRFKKGTCPTWSNWAQNIISFFHLDLRFIDMSNDILFIILFFSLWPECHFILDFWKRINDRVAFTQASIYQTLASGFKTNLQAADQTTPQTLPQVPLAPQVEGKIPSCLG